MFDFNPFDYVLKYVKRKILATSMQFSLSEAVPHQDLAG